MDITDIIVAMISVLFGGSGIVMYALNRRAKKKDESSILKKILKCQESQGEGIVLGLENDAVIFKALRDHQINGESEAQEKKMNEYIRHQAESKFKIGG